MRFLSLLLVSVFFLTSCVTEPNVNTGINIPQLTVYNVSTTYYDDISLWNSMNIFYSHNNTDYNIDESGTNLESVRMGMDDNYIYVLWKFRDGMPTPSSGYNYTIDFITRGEDGVDKYTNLKVGSFNGFLIPHIPYGPLDPEKTKWITLWEGDDSDYKVGADFLLARFSKAVLLDKIDLGTDNLGGIGIYRDAEPTGFYRSDLVIKIHE